MIRRLILPAVLCLLAAAAARGEERFPPPDFESGYEIPGMPAPPAPRSEAYEALDAVLLAAALAAAGYLALKRRSRRGLFLLMLLSLAYFGFWRQGCVCPVGAVQNVSMALFRGDYVIPLTVLAFFLLPLAAALLFGRVFCAAVCPLGAIQDAVLIGRVKVPRALEHALGLLPYVYLGGAVALAATGNAFIICRYDPFVAFFRRSGSANMLILGACVLVVAAFVGRPYCRFVCPYGVLLRLCSRAAKWHMTITPDDCIQCRLCEDACPFGAILEPTQPTPAGRRGQGKGLLALTICLLPVLAAGGGWLGGRTAVYLARTNPIVRQAQRVRLERTGQVKGTTSESDAFRATGKTTSELYAEALEVKRQFDARWTVFALRLPPLPALGGIEIGWAHLFGGFVGVVIASKLIQLSVRRKRADYQPDRATCLSCGRCFAYCPRERARLKGLGRKTGEIEL